MNAINDLTMDVAEIDALLDGASMAELPVSTLCDATTDDTTSFLGSSYYC